MMETESDILRKIIENQKIIIKKLEEKIEIYERQRKETNIILNRNLGTSLKV